MQTNQVRGIVAYNKIRSKLSKEVKAKGIKLETGAFNTLSTNIFRHNKGKAIQPILTNIGEQIAIERKDDVGLFKMLPALLQGFYYWDFNNEYVSAGMHPGLWIVSDFMEEPVLARDLDYYRDIKHLVEFIDQNRTQEKEPDSDFWFYDYGVILQFTEPSYNKKTMRLESRLYASGIWSVYNKNQLPYEYGMSGYYDPAELGLILAELKKPTIPVEEPEPEREPEREKREKATERKERILELELEIAKEKRILAETHKIILDKYAKLYSEGLITKENYKNKLAKL